jgi:hypothetical protein
VKYLILAFLFCLASCDERLIPHAKVGDLVYPHWYECEFGVLYHDDRHLVNAEGKPIACETVYLKHYVLCDPYKPVGNCSRGEK